MNAPIFGDWLKHEPEGRPAHYTPIDIDETVPAEGYTPFSAWGFYVEGRGWQPLWNTEADAAKALIESLVETAIFDLWVKVSGEFGLISGDIEPHVSRMESEAAELLQRVGSHLVLENK